MASIEVHVAASRADVAYVESMLDGFAKAQGVVLRTAVNETLRRFRTKLTALISQEHLVGKQDIRSRVFISEGAHKDVYQGKVTVDHAQVPVYDFKVRYNKRTGIRVQMLASKPQEAFRYAFKSTMNSGHIGAFQRKKSAEKIIPSTGSYKGRVIKRGPNKGKYLKRQPIKELFGPPVVRAFDIVAGLTDQATADLDELFDDILDRKLQWQLQKLGK